MQSLEIPGITPVARAGRSHHWHLGRSAVSRRAFIGKAAGTAGVLLAANAAMPLHVAAEGGDDDERRNDATPRPVPGGTQPDPNGPVFHFFLPDPPDAKFEPATITDFHGLVGVAALQGTGTGRTEDGPEERLLFDLDMRFMKGVYVGKDGEAHKGTFGFI